MFGTLQANTSVEVEGEAPQEVGSEEQSGEKFLPPPENIMIMPPTYPVHVAALPVVPGAAPATAQIVAQPVPHSSAPVETSFYANAAGGFVASQPGQQAAPQAQPPRINDVIGTPNFFFLQESELDSTELAQPPPVNPNVAHIPAAVPAPIPTQTFTNQNFPTTVVPPPQVIYSQEMTPHMSGFAGPNPPPPIPMPPSHQPPNMQFSSQHPAGYQQDQTQQGHFEPVSNLMSGVSKEETQNSDVRRAWD